ncbi:hypothetical protein DLJ58_15220 [Micromonospora arida]|uniref:Uncharacterized protein n=1 Tax=Micromonospora arida TaxID=2203715 RepID=A0A3N9X8E8_9ACTN|nr:hypothetical protein DLJ58_15220 [Micromonospora arida]
MPALRSFVGLRESPRNLIGLAVLAVTDGDREAARQLLDEAAELAADSGAQGVGRWVEGARDELRVALS